MTEFRGVVNIDESGEIVCFCSTKEALQGKCLCRDKYNCPEAIISIDVIPGTRPSEQGARKVVKAQNDVEKEVIKIKEGLAKLERAVKGSKFRV